ncbi:MAG: GvpL/GvpF family gas vesicle protein [Pseudomonadota bacterium]
MPFFIYGITQSKPETPVLAKPIVKSDASLEYLECGDLYCIISEVDDEDILPVRRNLLGHSKILEEVMAEHTVIPMQFGIVMDHQSVIENIIKENASVLKNMLENLAGRIEVGLKVRLEEKEVFAEIAKDHPALQKTGATLNAKNENEVYYDRIELGRSVSKVIEEKRRDELQSLINRVAPHVIKLVELETGDEFTIANLALLVNKDKEQALYNDIVELDASQGERMHIKYVSPIPPYNFVSVQLNWQKDAA